MRRSQELHLHVSIYLFNPQHYINIPTTPFLRSFDVSSLSFPPPFLSIYLSIHLFHSTTSYTLPSLHPSGHAINKFLKKTLPPPKLIMAADQEIALIIVFVNFCSAIWSYFCITASLNRSSRAYELVHETELVWHAFWSSCQVCPPINQPNQDLDLTFFKSPPDLRPPRLRHKLRTRSLHRLPCLGFLRREIHLRAGTITKGSSGTTRGCAAAADGAGELYSVQSHSPQHLSPGRECLHPL